MNRSLCQKSVFQKPNINIKNICEDHFVKFTYEIQNTKPVGGSGSVMG
jgi:hypothetical protein